MQWYNWVIEDFIKLLFALGFFLVQDMDDLIKFARTFEEHKDGIEQRRKKPRN